MGVTLAAGEGFSDNPGDLLCECALTVPARALGVVVEAMPAYHLDQES
jgi:hypothetical protein